MAKLVTIFGGSGFVGRQVARQLAKQGWRIRIAVRRPDEALFTRTYGAVGQVVPVLCNLRDENSVRLAMTDVDAVVNCVNLLTKEGKSNFDNILDDGAGRIARLSKEMGIPRMVHLSGIGVNAQSPSKYIAAKARGEAAVLEHRPDAVILRPSVIFGAGDSFFNRLAGMTRLGPLFPILGAKTRFQPVHVDDVATAASLAVNGKAEAGIYELGGPDVITMRQAADMVLAAVFRRKLIVRMPFWMAKIGAGALSTLQVITGGLFTNTVLNADQIELLRHDNVVSDGAMGFDTLGIKPSPAASVINDYLWRFRPSGEYDDIKRSAKNLRTS